MSCSHTFSRRYEIFAMAQISILQNIQQSPADPKAACEAEKGSRRLVKMAILLPALVVHIIQFS